MNKSVGRTMAQKIALVFDPHQRMEDTRVPEV